MVRPNFFIIGAPKCGTTAMSEYLRTHPSVFMSPQKEPHFFSTDVLRSNFRTLEEYLGLFAEAGSEPVIAEASTSYIHSDEALGKLHGFNPEARLLVMLRRPTDLVYAYHGTALVTGEESEWNFERAWSLQLRRAAGESLPPGTLANCLRYRWIGSLGSQVAKVLETFPRERVHFILFEDFVRDTRSEYLRLLEFLGIPDDGRVDFAKANESSQFRFRTLARAPRYVRAAGGPYYRRVKKRLGLRWNLAGLIVKPFDRFNKVTRPRPPLRPEFRQHLDEVFRDEVVKLEKILGRDLSAWRIPR